MMHSFLLCWVWMAVARWLGASASFIVNWTSHRHRECSVLLTERIDKGYMGIKKSECESRGYCWGPVSETRPNIPWCYAPRSITPPFHITSIDNTNMVTKALLKHQNPSTDPTSATQLFLMAKHQSDTINIRITNSKSHKVPEFLYADTKGYSMPGREESTKDSQLNIHYTNIPFQFSVTRYNQPQSLPLFITKARNEFDPHDSLIFKQHYIEIGTQLPKGHYIYGLGERVSDFRRKAQRMAFHARDTPATLNQNSYGSHPFYLEMRDGLAHGVLMLNSHPMEVELTDDSLIYRMLGGEIDLYIFAGPTPDKVIEQYTRIIGRPPLYDPRVLGLHQCRFGYQTLDEWRQVVRNYEDAHLPLDGIWFDIEYVSAFFVIS